VLRPRALLPLRRRLDRSPLPRRLRDVGPRQGRAARRRPRRRAPAREHPPRPRRRPPRRPRLPAGFRPRAIRVPGRGRDDRRRAGAPDRLRGGARARTPAPRPRPRAAARRQERPLRARDDGGVRPAARPHRRRSGAGAPRPRLPAGVGEACARRTQPRAEGRMSNARIAVVGGGLAGITAALECADAGADVTLYEGRPWLGGATFSFRRNGYLLDNGQHVALRCCTEYRRLLATLGTERQLELQPRLRIPVVDAVGRTATFSRTGLPAPLHLAGALLRFRHLSPLERAAAVRGVLALQRLDLDDPGLDDVAFGPWLRARGQSARAVERLWNLIALPTLNLQADDASLALAAFVFRTGVIDESDACDLAVPTVSPSTLHGDAARTALRARGVHVRLRTKVDRVRAAVPHHVAPGILPDGIVDVAATERLGLSPIVNVHLHYDRLVLESSFAAILASPPLWVFDRTASSGAEGGQLLSLSISGADDDLPHSRAQLVDRSVATLARALPRARAATLLDATVTREPAATFRGAPGSARLRP